MLGGSYWPYEAFEVQDITCGHCVSSITKAVRAVDEGSRVTADLATDRVRIEPTESDRSQLGDAIPKAGYTPVPIADAEMTMGQPVLLSLSLNDQIARALILIKRPQPRWAHSEALICTARACGFGDAQTPRPPDRSFRLLLSRT